MALTPTITANAYRPFHEKHDDFTPPICEILQTSGSEATIGCEIIGDPTVSDEFFLTSLQISIIAPTASAEVSVYLGKEQIAQFPTCTADVVQFQSLNFGEPGLMGGTTTTATVSVVSTATITCVFACLGKRKS